MKKASQYCKMSDHGYMGHFMQAKNIDRGHNDCPKDDADCQDDQPIARELKPNLSPVVDPQQERKRKEYVDEVLKNSGSKMRQFFKGTRKAFGND